MPDTVKRELLLHLDGATKTESFLRPVKGGYGKRYDRNLLTATAESVRAAEKPRRSF